MGTQRTVRPPQEPSVVKIDRADFYWRLIQVLLLLFVFLIGIRGLGEGFKGLGQDVLASFFHATKNPFVGLTIGILGTTLVQSSSVSTSMIVAMVAAPENPLPLANAVPMIMGANIGTTVTNTIVSLGHMGQPDEFRRAFAAATCHDFFNFIAVIVLLPLELVAGILSRPSHALAKSFEFGGGSELPNPIKTATKAALDPIEHVLSSISANPRVDAILLIAFSAVVIFTSLMLIVRSLRVLASTRLQAYLSRSLEASGYIGIIVGIVLTVMVQSSSITTSVLVPLAGAGMVTLEQVFPIALGANIGTTLTAFIASSATASETAALGVEIAMVHLLFNLYGTALVYPLRVTRRVPLRLSEWLAKIAVKSRKTALFYVFALFYGLPALLIAVSRYL
jgi:solute carrier family 34 (sodium-dependent phosphate cotransporter)